MARKKMTEALVITYSEARETLSLREKVGQFFMPAVFINDREEEIRAMEELIREGCVGGICFFHSRASAATNFEGKKKVIYNAQSYDLLRQMILRYQKAARLPLLISIDAEWGLAMRVEETPQYPYAMTLGAVQDPLMVYEVAKFIGQDCRTAGIHWNFAPVADINSNPENPVIGYRSFGSKREEVSMNAVAFSRGLQDGGVLSCAKHFPGHGDTATDSHLALPVLDKSERNLFSEELAPFKALIDNGVDAVMVGHIALPSLTAGERIPASVSKEIITGLLREKLNFNGVVVSDALNMHSVSRLFPEKGSLEWTAFEAGTDILCFAEFVREGVEAILSRATEERIEQSFKRVWRLKEKSIGQEGEIPDGLSLPTAFNKVVARNALTLYQGKEEDIQTFRKKGFYSIFLGKQGNRPFGRTIGIRKGNFLEFDGDISFQEVQKEVGQQTRILVAVYLPKAKPQDVFGLGAVPLKILNQLIQNYEVVVYLFGNPYFLRHMALEKVKAVVLAYQDLEGFEEVAGEHFLGLCKATGKLPVSL